MKMFRLVLLKLHQWLGLATGAFILVIALSGAAVTFEFEIDRSLSPRLSYVTPQPTRLPLQELLARFHAAYPEQRVVGISLPQQREFSTTFQLASGWQGFINQHTGEVLGIRNREETFARFLHLLHTRLVAGRAGEILVGTLTALSIVLVLSGLVLWWRRRILTWRRQSAWSRLNFDVHNVLGVYAAVFVLVMAATGVMITFEDATDPIVRRLDTAPAPPVPLSAAAQGTSITADRARAIADATVPGAMSTSITLPTTPRAVYRIIKKFPEDRTPAGRTRVYVDQYTGSVVLVENTRTAEPGTAILNLKRSAHTGDIFGWPTRALYFVAALMLAGQVVTGVIIWLRRRRRGTVRARAAAA